VNLAETLLSQTPLRAKNHQTRWNYPPNNEFLPSSIASMGVKLWAQYMSHPCETLMPMSNRKIRQSPLGAPIITSVSAGDNNTAINLKDGKSAECPSASNPTADACALYKPGHRVHFIQANKYMGKPEYKVNVLSTTGNSFTVSGDAGIATWWTHKPEQIQELILFYGAGLVGWLHESGLFECQGHLFYIASSAESFEPCRAK